MTDQPKRGGVRPGAGRPRVGTARVAVNVLLRDEAQQEKFRLLGGSAWLRERIDRARLPIPPESASGLSPEKSDTP